MARWWNGRHVVLRRPCPPRREGSSPSLVTARLCPVLRTQAPALRRLVGQFDSGMGYCGLSRGFRALGLRSPVGRFDSCTTYWIGQGACSGRGSPGPLQPGWRRFLGSVCEESVAKIKGKRGFRVIKELGGAIRRGTVSQTARFLDEHRLVRGRVLDYGCGFGFDADHFGWEAYDPHYRQKLPDGAFETIVCNHVANMLTRDNRRKLFWA